MPIYSLKNKEIIIGYNFAVGYIFVGDALFALAQSILDTVIQRLRLSAMAYTKIHKSEDLLIKEWLMVRKKLLFAD